MSLHKLSLVIASVQESNIKSSVKEMIRYFKNKHIKVKSAKVGKLIPFNIEEEKYYNIQVSLKIMCDYDRYQIKNIVEPKYKIEKLSYGKDDSDV
jgi:hypothetical protein